MTLLIRKIKQSDNLLLARMIRTVFEEHDAPRQGTVYSDPTTDDLYGLFQIPGSVIRIAEWNGEAVGCCGIYPTPGLEENCAELVKFYLSATARGKGIGRELMQQCIGWAKEYGYTKLYLESLPHYAHAVYIYEKQGFVRLERPMGNSGHGSCSIWMAMELV